MTVRNEVITDGAFTGRSHQHRLSCRWQVHRLAASSTVAANRSNPIRGEPDGQT
jgi:hypothetical protein